MSADESPPPGLLSDYWDGVAAREIADMGGPESDLAETIHRLHRLDDAPAPDHALIQRMWREAVRQADLGVPLVLDPTRAPGVNGHGRPAPMVGAGTGRTWWAPAAAAVAAALRLLAVGVLAGLTAGVVAGIGARLAMRIAALMADPSRQGMLTENGNRVGEITLGGTMELIGFVAMIGMVGGLTYVIVRPWLPATGWRRGLLFGVFLLAISGWFALEPDNPDYQRLGSAGVNVCLFSLVFVAFGLVVAPLADRLDRAIPAALPRRSRRPRTLLASFGVIAAGLPGLLILGGATLSGPAALVIVGLPLLRLLLGRLAGGFDRPTDLLSSPRLAVAGYAVVLVPSLIGLVMTVRAVGRIVGTDG